MIRGEYSSLLNIYLYYLCLDTVRYDFIFFMVRTVEMVKKFTFIAESSRQIDSI